MQSDKETINFLVQIEKRKKKKLILTEKLAALEQMQ